MSDFSLDGGDALDAGLAQAFGTPRPSVLNELERGAHEPFPRVALRESLALGESAVLRGVSAAPQVGATGRSNYQIHGEIARGGMGVLLKGQDLDLGREVALKVLREDLADRPEIVRRFVEEAQVAGQLQHPGVVPVYELGLMADRRPYFAMKLVRGRTLAAALAERDPAQRRRWVDVFASVCQTIAYAHSRGVVHRDIKPANILIGAFGEVQVIDWGLAKVVASGGTADERRARALREGSAPAIETVRSGSAGNSQAGSVMGTPAYMAPEQARGDSAAIDERTDVFALGATLCEILTGDPPYVGATEKTVVQAAHALLEDARGRLDQCGADRELVALCKECLAPEPGSRPRNAEVVAARVSSYLASLGERARKAELSAAEARIRVRSTVTLASVVVLALAGGGLALSAWRQERGDRALAAERASSAAVEEAQLARGRGDWEEAQSAARLAVARLEGAVVPEALRAQVQSLAASIADEAERARATRELELDTARWLAELEALRQPEGDTIYARDWERLDRDFAATFEARGLAVDSGSESELAAGLARRGVALELAALIDEWGYVRRRAGKPQGARRLRLVADALDPDPLRTSLRAALESGDETALRDAARRGLAEPLPATTLRLVASSLRQGPDAGLALELLRAGRRQHPTDFAIAMELARALRRASPPRYTEALGLYQAALSLRPQNVEAWHELAMTLHPLLGRAEESLATLRELVERIPGDGHLQFHVGAALTGLGRHDEALAAFERARALGEESALLFTNVGISEDQLGRGESAVRSYERALELDPGLALAHHNLGVALRRQGRLEEASARVERALELDSKLVPAATEAAYLLYARKDWPELVRAGERAVALDPKNALHHQYLARGLEGVGRIAESRASYERALAIAPDSTSPRRSLVLLLLTQRDDPRAALAHARELAQRASKEWVLHGIAAYAAGELSEARAVFGAPRTEADEPVRALFLALCEVREGGAARANELLGPLDLAALEPLAWLIGPYLEEARELLAR